MNEMLPVARQDFVSPRECLAMRLLHEDGWSRGELALALERKGTTITRHLDRECRHQGSGAPPEALPDAYDRLEWDHEVFREVAHD